MTVSRNLFLATLVLLTAFFSTTQTLAADWPMWRYSAGREGSSPERLPEQLHLQWVLELPEPQPAWPTTQEKIQFDRLYEPVLKDGRLYIPSMVRDKVSAFDAETGNELWSFYADGPVRFAPVCWKDKVLFVSDDGYLYCVNGESGKLAWKLRGGPSDRKVLGNFRLVSMWPARGAPVIYDDILYFGASIWPFMGTFLHAVDPETGAIVWTNSGSGSQYLTQQHFSPAFAGVAPQGYLAATEKHLIVSGGRTLPAVYDRATGNFLHYNVSSRKMGSKGGGGYGVTAGEHFYLNRGSMYRMDNGKWVTNLLSPILTKKSMIGVTKEGIRGYHLGFTEVETKDNKGKTIKKLQTRGKWSADFSEKIQSLLVLSGQRLYCRGEGNNLLAIDLPGFDEEARVSWRFSLPDEPLNVITGGGRLFVSSNKGRIYCFGAEDRGLTLEKPESVGQDFIARDAEWRYLDDGSDQGVAWRAPSFDDENWAKGKAPLGYGDEGLTTTVKYGQDGNKKFITTYFRHDFEVPAGDLSEIQLSVQVDDGAVVYMNGDEVGRIGMPDGAVTHKTLASGNGDENTLHRVKLAVTQLKPGPNVLGVEVHQAKVTSSDIRLAVHLSATVRESASRTDGVAASEGVAAPDKEPSGDWKTVARTVLRQAESRSGYCFALGLGSGGLIREILRQSDLHVIAIEEDAERADAFRRAADREGIYGSRVAVVVGSLDSIPLPKYLAEVIITESMPESGVEHPEAFAAQVFERLRPYSGVACLPMVSADQRKFANAVEAAELEHAEFDRVGELAILKRLRPPSGSGEWTHQYGTAGNTNASSDSVVKTPLGLLWFGGPSNEGILPRHGHGPTPHVAGGRVFIEGRDMLRALDAYSGRQLWQRTLKDVGKNYDYTSHEPGANAIGSNYVSLADSVYVAYGDRCLQLDSRTGDTMWEWTLPKVNEEADPPTWGFIAAWKNILIGGEQSTGSILPVFTDAEVKGLKDDALKKSLNRVKNWLGFDPVALKDKQPLRVNLLLNVNKILLVKDLPSKIPENVKKAVKDQKRLAENVKKLKDYYAAVPGRKGTDTEAMIIKRELLHLYYGLPQFKSQPLGKFGTTRRFGSKKLVGMDRHTGRVLWEYEAGHEIRPNAIAIGGGAIYVLDRMPDWESSYYKRRGEKANERARLIAIDIRNGEELWSTDQRIFGTWLGYSKQHDIVLQAGSQARDRARDEVGQGLVAYRGSDGKVLWDKNDKYDGPCILIGDRVITQGFSGAGFALNILTGERVRVEHPVTGNLIDWGYKRNYGCNTAIGSPNMLTFRSAAAGYFDLLREGGTGNFGGFRTGCTSNLIPADGILSSPDYTRTCTCSYQNQSSLALVHMPEVELWTFNAYKSDEKPVKHLGINFGAPGDRRDGNGTLWLDYPSVGGDSPNIPVSTGDSKPSYKRFHTSRVRHGSLPWVGSSALNGQAKISLRLAPDKLVSVDNAINERPTLTVRGASIVAEVAEEIRDESKHSLACQDDKAFALSYSHKSMASPSITAELWANTDADTYFFDARGDKVGPKDKQRSPRQGFVLNGRELHARYYVADADRAKPDKVVELKASRKIEDKLWTHVAFTYDATTGVGKLFLDGEVVASHDGPDNRGLWWRSESPKVLMGRGASKATRFDEIRLSNKALSPASFLNVSSPEAAKSQTLAYFPVEPRKIKDRDYTVRLVFADLLGHEAGEQAFDVSLQGETVLSSFDIAKEAGGAYRSIVREFTGVRVASQLEIELSATDENTTPSLAGVEVLLED